MATSRTLAIIAGLTLSTVVQAQCNYNINNHCFNNFANYTFESGLPAGLAASDETDPGAVYNYTYSPSQVDTTGGVLNLHVQKAPPDPEDGNILCGQVYTVEQNITSGSVTVSAKLSPVPGVVNGIFFYKDNSADGVCSEADIEYMPSTNSGANEPYLPNIPIHYTNHASSCKTETQRENNVSAVVDGNWHEYRIDWLANEVDYYVDGELAMTINTDVPTAPAQFIVNLWSDADPGWAGEAPEQDAVMSVQWISMYYNVSPGATKV